MTERSNWSEATEMLNLTFIQLIIDICWEWFEQYGQKPKASQVRSRMQSPGL